MRLIVPCLLAALVPLACSHHESSAPGSTAAPAPPAPPKAPEASAGRAGAARASPGCSLPASCAPIPDDLQLSIKLERTACLGRCPVYDVTLDRDGTVTWNGYSYVAVKGTAHAHVDPKKVQALAKFMERSCFFNMQKAYRLPVTDHPWANTTLSVNGVPKTVRHYLASLDAMPSGYHPKCPTPPVLSKIEDRIDALAGVKRWIGQGR